LLFNNQLLHTVIIYCANGHTSINLCLSIKYLKTY